MRTCGFEKIERPFNNYCDLAVSNIPFGDMAVVDAEFQRSDSFGRRSAQKTIHNYFFLKGLDAVRDGGIVAFITSQGVLGISALGLTLCFEDNKVLLTVTENYSSGEGVTFEGTLAH